MHRFLQNYVVQESDSIVSNDYNWDEISVGNDTLAVDRFFGKIYSHTFFFPTFRRNFELNPAFQSN